MKHFKLFSSLKAVVCIAALWGGLCSCSGLDGIFSDDEDDSSSKESSFTGKYTEPTTGTVTFYEGYDATSVAYYVPLNPAFRLQEIFSVPNKNGISTGPQYIAQ